MDNDTKSALRDPEERTSSIWLMAKYDDFWTFLVFSELFYIELRDNYWVVLHFDREHHFDDVFEALDWFDSEINGD